MLRRRFHRTRFFPPDGGATRCVVRGRPKGLTASCHRSRCRRTRRLGNPDAVTRLDAWSCDGAARASVSKFRAWASSSLAEGVGGCGFSSSCDSSYAGRGRECPVPGNLLPREKTVAGGASAMNTPRSSTCGCHSPSTAGASASCEGEDRGVGGEA